MPAWEKRHWQGRAQDSCFSSSVQKKWSWKESPARALEEPSGVLCSCGLWESCMNHLNTVNKN